MHGRLTTKCEKFTCLLHVSLDPYNTTEEMEVTWTDLVLDWTNGKEFIQNYVCLVIFYLNKSDLGICSTTDELGHMPRN